MTNRGEAGSVTFPLLLGTVLISLIFIGFLGLRLSWRLHVKTQFRLDRCVEGVSLKLASIQNFIEASNKRMKLEQATALLLAVPTDGASLEVSEPILLAEKLAQDFELARWKLEQVKWIAQQGCDGKMDFFLPLPSLKWERPPDSIAGAMPLTWEGEENESLKIRLWRLPEHSTSEVKKSETGLLSNTWKARWTSIY